MGENTLENILAMEVPLRHSDVFSFRYGANISFLDGSVFPTGTIKDIRNAVNIMRDREQSSPIVYYHITSGNSGKSLAILAEIERKDTGRTIETFCVIPEGYDGFKAALEKLGSIVVEADVSRFISDEEIADTINGELARRGLDSSRFHIKDISTRRSEGFGYSRLGEETLRQNPDADVIFVPYGSGETGLGIYNFYRQKFDEGLTAKMPAIVFVEVEGKKNTEGKNLTEDKTRTKYVSFENRIDELVKEGKAAKIAVTEEERDAEYSVLLQQGIKAEKTSALPFAGAKKYGLMRGNNAVILNTGQGVSYQRIM